MAGYLDIAVQTALQNMSMNGAPSGGQQVFDINQILGIDPKTGTNLGAMTASLYAVTDKSGYTRPAKSGSEVRIDSGKSNFGDKLKTAANQFTKFSNSSVGTAVGNGINIVSSFIKDRPEYSGKEGAVTQGIDTAYDAVSKAVQAVPVYGQAISLAMGAGKLLNKIAGRIGGGTDSMTKTDAILGSNFLGWTPLGLINGFGGKRAKNYSRNYELDAATNGGYQGFLVLQDATQVGAGKKYGLFSSGARHKQNELTDYTKNMKHTIDGIVDTNILNLLSANAKVPFLAQQQSVDLSGGIQQMRAARSGMKIEKYQNPANPFISKKNPFKMNQYKRPQGVKNLSPKPWGPEGMQLLYDKDGNPTRGLTRALELGYEPVVGYDGKPRFIGYKSNPALPYMLSAKKINMAGNGMQFAHRTISKYQMGSKLKRSIQTIDVATGKYVDLPTDLTKEQVNGQMPIKLANGTVVFMLKNGTVTSDRWETVSEREHLTPKGLSGMKTQRHWRKPANWTELKIPYSEWIKDINPEYLSPNYDLRLAYLYLPKEDLERWKFGVNSNDPKYYANYKDESGNYIYHLGSIAQIPNSEDYVFLKKGTEKTNPELHWETDSYHNGKNGLKSTHKLSYEGDRYYYRRVPNHKNGEFKLNGHIVSEYKEGGQMNVIPEGALHARLNHLDLVDLEVAKSITHKGIPVISVEEGGEIVQHAEIEHSEIILTKEVTDKIEALRKENTDESAIEAGKLLTYEILHNTDDRTNLIKLTE